MTAACGLCGALVRVDDPDVLAIVCDDCTLAPDTIGDAARDG